MGFKAYAQAAEQTGLLSLFRIGSDRIAWIDVAKGIAILLVIIGHTVEFGSPVRNMIFSFHMPLFFILSGYTFKLANGASEFLHRVKGLVEHLIYPSLLVSAVTVLAQFLYSGDGSAASLWMFTKQMGNALLWASGVEKYPHPGIGALWFMFSLFWAKVLMDGIHILFPGKRVGYIFAFIGLLGLALGIQGQWLPQNMDVTFTAVFFIYVGMLWRTYKDVLQRYESLIFAVSAIIWAICLNRHIYIEMASRSYPWSVGCIIEAVCASYAVCCLCRALSVNHRFRYPFQFLGMHTLLIFLVHHLDWIIDRFWQMPSMEMTIGLRVLSVLFIFLIIYTVHFGYIRYRKHSSI